MSTSEFKEWLKGHSDQYSEEELADVASCLRALPDEEFVSLLKEMVADTKYQAVMISLGNIDEFYDRLFVLLGQSK